MVETKFLFLWDGVIASGNSKGPHEEYDFKNGAILYNKAEVFSLSVTNPNGRPMLPFDWLAYSNVRQLAPWTIRPRSSDSVVDKRTKNNYRGQPKAGTGLKMLFVPFVFSKSRFQGPAFRWDKIVVIVTLLENKLTGS